MGLERRLELLDWANKNDVWVIEDDYNSEFRHQDSMIASLRSLDREGRVIYLGTFSKVMMPNLRLGYIVANRHFIDGFSRGRARIDVHASGIGQLLWRNSCGKGTCCGICAGCGGSMPRGERR
jgi:GntR family transcriptional regulator/MocR family aminotransferase